MHGYGSVVGGIPGSVDRGNRSIDIQAVDNGWVVTVQNPIPRVDPNTEMLGRYFSAIGTVLPEINRESGAAAVEGIDEELDPYKRNDESRQERQARKQEILQKVIKEATTEPKRPLRRPFEVYVFLDKAKLISFLNELLVIESPVDPIESLPKGSK